MEISYWSDIACPFCYIGASRMKRAMAAVGLKPEDLTMKAYQLNPNAPLDGPTCFAPLKKPLICSFTD